MALPVIGGSDGAWGTTLTNFLGGAAGDGTPTIPNNRIPYLSSGNHTSSANLTFDGTTLTIPATVVTASAALTITPAAGTNLNIVLSTTGDFVVNTNDFVVDTSLRIVGIGTASPSAGNAGRSLEISATDAGASLLLSAPTAGGTFEILSENTGGGRLAIIRASIRAISIVGTNLTVGNSVAIRATTDSTNGLVLYNGTAPVGTLAAGITLYSTAGELNVMDAGGTATSLSPHRASIINNYQDLTDPFPWIYAHRNPYLGIEQEVVMSAVIREVEKLSGKTFIKTKQLPLEKVLDWDTDQEKLRLEQEKSITAEQNRITTLDTQIVTETDLEKKAKLTKQRNAIKVPMPYVKQRPAKWMVDRGVVSTIVEK